VTPGPTIELDMQTSDFTYDLPPELIAQSPAPTRDGSRLLHLDRAAGSIAHLGFRDLPSLLRPGDRLVFNDTRVVPARLWCRKETGGRVELLFTRKRDERTWEAAAKPRRRLQPGTVLRVEAHPATHLRIVEVPEMGGGVVVEMADRSGSESIESVMAVFGEIPLPHYIQRSSEQAVDRERYQTVYAREPGAIAAPTAGLHFTDAAIAELRAKGVAASYVTLHVGMGTFRPVQVDDPRDHDMHEEFFHLSAKTVEEISSTRQRGGRIIAVGTTAVRVLEHCASQGGGTLAPLTGSTRLLILPGYVFAVVDCLITNFHLPRSTLLMLVSAFAGREFVLRAYREAVEQRYRFFSYGDAMFIG